MVLCTHNIGIRVHICGKQVDCSLGEGKEAEGISVFVCMYAHVDASTCAHVCMYNVYTYSAVCTPAWKCICACTCVYERCMIMLSCVPVGVLYTCGTCTCAYICLCSYELTCMCVCACLNIREHKQH